MGDVVGISLSEVLTGNYEVKIQNYSKLDKTVGASIWSPKISLLGRQWKLEINLGGNKEEDKEYISIFLHYERQGNSEVTASGTFTLVDQVNKNPQSISHTLNKSIFGHNRFANKNWGYKKFVEQSLLTDANSPFIVDDAVIIRLEISMPINTALETIAEAEPLLTKLYHSGEGSDVSVVIQDAASQVSDRVPSHKLILMARSPVFKAMFTHNMSESNTNEIVISDFSPEVVREMLHFMYTDKLQSETLDNTVYEGLLGAAIKYDVPELAKLCEAHFCKQLTYDTVLDLVSLANATGAMALKQKCVCYVKNNAERLLKSHNSDAFLSFALDATATANVSIVGQKRKASDGESSGHSGNCVSDNNECVVM